jgi:hypothetical protein
MKSYRLEKWEMYALCGMIVVHTFISIVYSGISAAQNLKYLTIGVMLTMYFLQFVGRVLFYVYSLSVIPIVALGFQMIEGSEPSKMVIMILFEVIAFASLCLVFFIHMRHRKDDNRTEGKKR